MHLVLLTATFAVAALTAVRSTWSPCGRSMLSTITPIGERGRGVSYAASAAWFVTGAVAGGSCLGGALAALAALARSVGGPGVAPAAVLATLTTVAAIVCAGSDTGITSHQLPFHRRQVNELWLDRFRPWVYGAGFGWQIGVGFATYVTSAGLYLFVLLAALLGSPAAALGAGILFGTVRGLAVLLGRRLTDPGALRRFHRRFDAAEAPVRRLLVAAELAVAVGAAALLWAPVAVVVGATAVVVGGTRVIRHRAGRVAGEPAAGAGARAVA